MEHWLGIPIPARGWGSAVSQAVATILSRPPVGVQDFPRTLAIAAAHSEQLAREATARVSVTVHGAIERYPLAATILLQTRSPSGSTALARTLTWLLLELHIGRAHPDLVERLSRVLRGTLRRRQDHRLLGVIGECDGLLQLSQKMTYLREKPIVVGALTGHAEFDSLWTTHLAAACQVLLRGAVEPTSDRETAGCALDVRELNPLSGPEEGEEGDDEYLHVIDALAPEDFPESRRAALLQSDGHALFRRGSPGLLRHPTGIAPRELMAREWTAALSKVRTALTGSDLRAAEEGLLRLLAIESGLSAAEAATAAFGSASVGGIVVFDVKTRALRRPERRPVDAFEPAKADDAWLATGGDIVFPVSRPTVAAANRIRRLHKRLDSFPDARLVSMVSPKDLRIALNGERSIVSASTCRLRLAASLAHRLGPDISQIAFGETFGLSAGATYYSAVPVSRVATEIARANDFLPGLRDGRGAQKPSLTPMLGSRVRPSSNPFHQAWQDLGVPIAKKRGRPSIREAIQSLARKRDSLLVHFLLATGHRPVKKLGAITVKDFIPRHALVVVGDKRVDPAHLTRLVCTGWAFTGVLGDYVSHLRFIARQPALGRSRRVADQILTGERPLFSIPTEEGEVLDFDLARLVHALPAPWSSKSNLHRHALNQWLIAAGVDPELRFFQMGWMPFENHATSAAAPYPPSQLGADLGGIVDEWLQSIGWLGVATAADSGPHVPLGLLSDWAAERQQLRKEAESKVASMRATLNERRREVTPTVRELLQAQISKHLPGWRIGSEKGHPVLLPPSPRDAPTSVPIIGEAVVKAIIGHFRTPGFKPMHEFVARREMASMLTKAVRTKTCQAYIPAVPSLSPSRIPSPFVEGLGQAVEQATAIRSAVRKCSAALGKSPDAAGLAELAVITTWSIASSTPYRDLSRAIALMRALSGIQFAANENWILRIPLGAGHAAISGEPSVLVNRLIGLRGWKEAVARISGPGCPLLARFVRTHLPELCEGVTAPGEINHRMCSALAAAGAVELTGAERMIMDAVFEPATVCASRAASVADDLTLAFGDGAEEQGSRAIAPGPEGSVANPDHRPLKRIDDVMCLFNPDYIGLIEGVPAWPAKQRKRQLLPLVERRLVKLGKRPTLHRMVLEYVRHLLVRGGPRSAGGMEISTIYKIYHHLSPSLRAVDPAKSAQDLSAEAITGALLASITKARRKSQGDVIASLKGFFEFAALHHDLAEPDWSILQLQAGQQIRGSDPAVVSDSERQRLMEELRRTVVDGMEEKVPPQERRFRELICVAALLLDASGARPSSIQGLTFADFHDESEGVFIHLRPHGRYASTKTSTSAGFIRLEGQVWEANAAWFTGWLEEAKGVLGSAQLEEIPLFQIPGEPLGARYPMQRVFGRVGQLVRWSTRQPNGRAYWLRKHRVAARHREVARTDALARHVSWAMRSNGHVLLVTPAAHYVGDPAAIAPPRMAEGPVSRSAAAALSALDPRTLDQRWRRWVPRAERGQGVDALRLAAVLDLPAPSWGDEPIPPAPDHEPFERRMSWTLINLAMSVAARADAGVETAKPSALSTREQERLTHLMGELERRTGIEFGTHKDQVHRPRKGLLSVRLDRLLAQRDERLETIAAEWVTYARVASPRSGCVLHRETELARLRILSAEVGLETEERDLGGGLTLVMPRKSGGGAHYSGWLSLRWALLVAWVAARMDEPARRAG